MTLDSEFWERWVGAGDLEREVLVGKLMDNMVARYIPESELATVAAILNLYFEDLMQYLEGRGM